MNNGEKVIWSVRPHLLIFGGRMLGLGVLVATYAFYLKQLILEILGVPVSAELAGKIAMGELILSVFLILYLCRLLLIIATTSYKLTNTRLIIKEGIIHQIRDEIELFRVKDYQLHSPLALRIFGVSHMVIISSDATNPTKTLLGLKHAEDKINMLRDLVKTERINHNVFEVD